MKLNGEKIRINLVECGIKENFYFEEVNKVHSMEARSYNALIGQANRNTEQQSRYASVIVYHYIDPRTGKTREFISPIIQKDKISLGFILAGKKETFVYADRGDPGNYFFDVDFLAE